MMTIGEAWYFIIGAFALCYALSVIGGLFAVWRQDQWDKRTKKRWSEESKLQRKAEEDTQRQTYVNLLRQRSQWPEEQNER
ncbi:hypothetical protein [Ruegeria sp. HKCCA5763]|uniref:hypothetical protein n=1 Tax=Ruegeria sp. HKCCA5763 TaxID=2682987 RepID=UPI001489E128|nr:hypothetical protein [Ruegeria sp. HKCCA5763]